MASTTTVRARPETHDESLIRLGSPGIFFAGLALFFAIHIGIRLFISPIPMLDESWQLTLAQEWSLGYHAHPPLYTWLQIVVFKVFGETIFALALLKNSLLFALYAFTYASARMVTRRHDLAAFATLCLLLVPQIAWESQRDLTHSVLLSTTTAATLWAFLRLTEKQSSARYLGFGACAGLALLSKYNSGLFLLGFAVGALTVKSFRSILLSPRMMLALAACVVVAAPHFLWAARHASEAFGSTSKLDFDSYATWSRAAVYVPIKLAKAALPNLIPLVVVYVLATLKQRPLTIRSDLARMLFWGSVASILILAVTMLATKASGIRGRWFQPVFVCGPVLLVAQVNVFPRWLVRLAMSVAFGGAIVVMILLPWNTWRGGGTRNHNLTSITVQAVTEAQGETLRAADVILTDDFWIAGAMRHAFRKPVAMPQAPLKPDTAPRRIVTVFAVRRITGPPEELKQLATKLAGHDVMLRVTYISPDTDTKRIGMRVGVAVAD